MILIIYRETKFLSEISTELVNDWMQKLRIFLVVGGISIVNQTGIGETKVSVIKLNHWVKRKN